MSIYETDDYDKIRKVAHALSGQARMDIIKLLCSGPRNINEIADALEIPVPTATVNTKQLEEAGIIAVEYRPGRRGQQKICRLKYSQLNLKLSENDFFSNGTEIIEMPVGNFINAELFPPCGICTSEHQIGKKDDVRVFFSPERTDASLIWFTRGKIEYRFPNPFYGEAEIDFLELSVELCSEVPYFNNHARSETGLEINGVALPSWTSPGDFGGRRGIYTPKWWGIHKTQYGVLVRWEISKQQTLCNDAKTSGLTVKDIMVDDFPFINIAFFVDEKSNYRGGVNLFGKGFGNHDQDIILKLRAM